MNNLPIIYSQTISIPIKETYKVLDICHILLYWIVSQFDIQSGWERCHGIDIVDESSIKDCSNQFNWYKFKFDAVVRYLWRLLIHSWVNNWIPPHSIWLLLDFNTLGMSYLEKSVWWYILALLWFWTFVFELFVRSEWGEGLGRACHHGWWLVRMSGWASFMV